MAIESVSDVLSALADGREQEIVGLEESQWFEAKAEPYRLVEDSQKWELGKDLTAMANGGGGVIVVGAKTARAEQNREERVTSVKPVPASMVNLQQYRNVIEKWTFPPLGNYVALELYDRDNNKVYLSIEIGLVPPDEQPVMAKSDVATVGDSTVPAWAIARRVGAGTEWLPAAMVWADIRDGRLARKNLTMPSSAPDIGNPADRVAIGLDSLERALGAEESALICLAAVPPRGTRIEDFYGPDGVRGLLGRLPDLGLRHAGFGLGYGTEIQAIDGALADLEPRRRGLLVEPDGLVMAAVVGTPEMLGWAQERFANIRRDRGMLRINPFVFTEWPLEFTRFVRGHLMERVGQSSGWRYWAAVRRLKSGEPPVYLAESNHSLSLAAHDPVVDSSENFIDPGDDVETDAYRLLFQVSQWFGLSEPLYASGNRIAEETIRGWS